jgi:hypothetical protein
MIESYAFSSFWNGSRKSNLLEYFRTMFFHYLDALPDTNRNGSVFVCGQTTIRPGASTKPSTVNKNGVLTLETMGAARKSKRAVSHNSQGLYSQDMLAGAALAVKPR